MRPLLPRETVERTVEGAACRTGEGAVVASYGPHHGEEDCLSGWRGSGTIFFSWCNLRCVFCQNWDISQKGIGREVAPAELAAMMLGLQAYGCHNINFVSPSHVVAQILAAVEIAARQGLTLPLVYNTGGYDSMEALALLDGVIDIYMPDMKYGDAGLARKYSKARDYVAANRAAVKEMHRQVSDLVTDARGMARRGLLVRHLVLPGGIAGTDEVAAFLAGEVSRDAYVNIMDSTAPAIGPTSIRSSTRPSRTTSMRPLWPRRRATVCGGSTAGAGPRGARRHRASRASRRPGSVRIGAADAGQAKVPLAA